jgi:CRP-like cAMP-binding protein
LIIMLSDDLLGFADASASPCFGTYSDAVIKLIDFGCAVVHDDEYDGEDTATESLTGRTLAYCPPEVLSRTCTTLESSVDMWALGIIIYIMLTAIHPYDLSGTATDDEVAQAIVKGKAPPLRNSPLTAHLSESAIDLMENLMQLDPKKRLTADQMLEHPWTRGLTASRDKIKDSDKKLSMFREFKSGIAEKVFENIIGWADDMDNDDVARRLSLIERAFRSFDSKQKGYISRGDLQGSVRKHENNNDVISEETGDGLSLSGFSDLLSDNMKNRYFPKGTIVYREGDIGNAMYIINSGTISVNIAGSRVERGPGNFFGEGALLNPTKIRSATIRCETPVHALEISREYFEKYLAKSDSSLLLTIFEKDKIRKRNRAKMILRMQKDLHELNFQRNEPVFVNGDSGDALFLVESGNIHITEDGNHVFTATPGNLFGEYSLIAGRPRNCTAMCGTREGCVVQEMKGDEFRRLTSKYPEILVTLRDLCARRDFKKAVVMRLKKEFPYTNPREAFDAIKTKGCQDDCLSKEAIASLMRELNPDYSDEEISEIMRVLDLTQSGSITFDEFEKVFIADIRKSAAV